MEKIKKSLTKQYQLPFSLNESVISMILGVVVVILVGLVAYNYFRTNREVTPVDNTAVTSQNGQGKIDSGKNAVALPSSHTVADGENLWTISEKYYRSGYNFVDIAKTNGLTDSNLISAGQKLTIPKVEIRQPLTVADSTVPTVTTSRIEGNSYSVVKGDSVWEIAVRAYGDGFRFQEIVTANNLSNPSLIHPGNVLKIPR